MAVYFFSALGIPVIRIGHSYYPTDRIGAVSVWSPVPLRIEATDENGDLLTETELHHRFRDCRSHGSWFFATSRLLDTMEQTRKTGAVPNGLYLPRHCLTEHMQGLRRRHPRGILFGELEDRFGLTEDDVKAICSLKTDYARRDNLSINSIPALVIALQERGFNVTHHDLCEPPSGPAAPANSALEMV